jgi:hypothetical protein
MIIPVLVLLTPMMALGIFKLNGYLKRNLFHWDNKNQYSSKVIFGSIIFLLIASSWAYVDRSHDDEAYKFAKTVISSVKPNALILGQWTTAPLLDYMQIVERQRPDVTVLDRGLISLGIRDRLT